MDRADIDMRIKHAAAEQAERAKQRKLAESNPLIFFPAQMLAAGGDLTISADHNLIVPKEKGYNIRIKNGLGGILQVRDWIDNAYWFYLDILENPMYAVRDELLAIDEFDFFDCPKEMSPFGEECRKWYVGQVVNRKPKAGDSRRLRIATFIVRLLDYEDLCERPPNEIDTDGKWYIVYNLLQQQWRITLSKILDFAVKNKPESNVEKLLQDIISSQTKQDEKLDAIKYSTDAAAKDAATAAARNLKELKAKSKGGKKGAAIAKAERGDDKERKAILDDAKELLKEWDKLYPDRHKKPRDEEHSDAVAFRIVANRHKGADGAPIKSAEYIGRTLRREKAKGEKRGKYSRTGKKRGKYKPRT